MALPDWVLRELSPDKRSERVWAVALDWVRSLLVNDILCDYLRLCLLLKKALNYSDNTCTSQLRDWRLRWNSWCAAGLRDFIVGASLCRHIRYYCRWFWWLERREQICFCHQCSVHLTKHLDADKSLGTAYWRRLKRVSLEKLQQVYAFADLVLHGCDDNFHCRSLYDQSLLQHWLRFLHTPDHIQSARELFKILLCLQGQIWSKKRGI